MSKKKTEVPPTLEEQIAAAIASDRSRRYGPDALPIPKKKLEVGQEVYAGQLADAVVVAVIDEGRRAVIHYTHLKGKSVDTGQGEKRVNVFPSFDLQPKELASTDNFSQPHKYFLHYSQRDIAGLMTMVCSFGVEMDPPYQRGLVWEEEDKVKLIESLFNQVDIGKFVFRKMPYKDNAPSYEIVDGKQRLSALLEFMADGFAYRGKTWSQLSKGDRGYIDSYPVSYAQLAETLTDKEVMDTFVRLNTGGKPVDEEHLERVAEMARAQVVSRSTPKM